jgi:hypothetical protein
VGPHHALVQITIKQKDLPEAKAMRIMKVNDENMEFIEDITPKSK